MRRLRWVPTVVFCAVIVAVLVGISAAEMDQWERTARMTAIVERAYWDELSSEHATEEAQDKLAEEAYYDSMREEAEWATEVAAAGYATEAAYEATEDAAYAIQAANQAWCDPNDGWTAGGCVPGDRDYDCPELKAMGIDDVPVLGSDWQRLDGYYNYQAGYWESPPDGLGCEWAGE